MLTVLWHDPDAANFKDYFPEIWLVQEGSFPGRTHRVSGPRAGAYEAKCDVTVNGTTVDFDYAPYPTFNHREGMLLGVIRLTFTGRDRRTVAHVSWKTDGETAFTPASATVAFEDGIDESTPLPGELPDRTVYVEGSVCRVVVNRIERDVRARYACIQHYGATCSVCGFDFQAVYGQLADGFIHVHHLKPLASIGESCVVDPITDLRPVCPNCHAVIHLGGETRSIDEVKQMIAQHRSSS